MNRIIMLCVIVCLLTGCGSDGQNETKKADSVDMETTRLVETAPSVETAESLEPESQMNDKTLIAYFTWADNTQVENPDGIDADATTSASVLVPGNVAQMASWIQSEVGGDLFSIQVQDLYSENYDECLERASEENADNARPVLSTHVEKMENYETIYLGYPNWWYACPMAVLSFIDEYNLEDKNIILFCSHGTGGLAGSVEAITAELPDSVTISDNVLGVFRSDVSSSENQVREWARGVNP